MANENTFNPAGVSARATADGAASAVLALPEAMGNDEIPSLMEFLSFDEPVVDKLPFLFLDGDGEANDGAFLRKVYEIAVAGRLLCGRVRWLDDIADSGEVAGSLEAVHRLSAAVHVEAAARFSAVLSNSSDATAFFAAMAELNARYAVSLTLDCAAVRSVPVNLSLTSYIEQAKARAVVVRSPVDALMLLRGADPEETLIARECFETLAAAMQIADDILDVEEDYEQNTFTWIVADTLSKLPDPSPSLDLFYESVLLGGSVERAFTEALRLYEEVAHMSRNRFIGIEQFAREEISRLRLWQEDVARMVAEARRTSTNAEVSKP